MQSLLIVGIIIFTGFVFGEIVTRAKLPRVTGYILAGILLNPGLFHFIPQDFVEHTALITNISLAFIAFSVGGTLQYARMKRLGKGILSITMFEAEFAFLAIAVGFLVTARFFIHSPGAGWFTVFIPVSLLIGSLGSPTDPAATLAVAHQYKAKGDVSSTIMGVAALDDATGIINYSLAFAVASICVLGQGFSVYSSVLSPLIVIGGAILLGIVFGFVLNVITRYIQGETEGVLIVLIVALLALCFGIATLLGVDELLATMMMGIIVANYNSKKEKIFQVLERYIEQLIFVLFFTLSAMHLKLSALSTYYILVILFVVFRIIGKTAGTMIGASVAKSPPTVKKYTIGGLIPQGGIVVGLALLIKQNHIFDGFSDIIISVIIGATVIHEIIGPITSKIALKKAGEINK